MVSNVTLSIAFYSFLTPDLTVKSKPGLNFVNFTVTMQKNHSYGHSQAPHHVKVCRNRELFRIPISKVMQVASVQGHSCGIKICEYVKLCLYLRGS